jgi:hypothetical protein
VLPLVDVDGEAMLRIDQVDQLPPFLMSVVSDADHWMFVSSRGGLTAGRVDASRCLFPYETDDRLHLSAPHTGPFTQLRVGDVTWRPFTGERRAALHKNIPGNRIVFEEHHAELGLTFRYAWSSSSRYGWVRSATLVAERTTDVHIVDGLRNVMPHGVDLAAQQQMSNLVNAYRRSEIDGRLGLFTLEAKLSDRAEPAESLRATVVWSHGLDGADVRTRESPNGPAVLTGRRGAYVLDKHLTLSPGEPVRWHLVADVAQSQSKVEALRAELEAERDWDTILAEEISAGTDRLIQNVASADGLQHTADPTANAHHFANVLFNNMRGGVFAFDDDVPGADVADFVRTRNRAAFETHRALLEALPERLSIDALHERFSTTEDPNLHRLGLEYLPITFSRRHGDPSRPWNRFAIHLVDEAGNQRLEYQGNWRDIFQNWEALCTAFPAFVEGIVAKFLNASTADGYNPYRVTREGIEWEVPEPDAPWSNIGYWGDHQIVYLLRLLELSRAHHPERLTAWATEAIFSYADVPYRIRPYEALLANPRSSIELDEAHDAAIAARVEAGGTDGKLLRDADGSIRHVNLVEKLLVPALAKLSNLVVDGGIWMNTQRPEWNDANNALAGYGLSMVTLDYLRRYLAFFEDWLAASAPEAVELSTEVAVWFDAIRAALEEHAGLLDAPAVSDAARREVLDALGAPYADYRASLYEHGLTGRERRRRDDLVALCRVALRYADHAIAASLRPDGLYHAYNVLHADDEGAGVEHLYEMLEGQVAVLSSGRLDAKEALALIDALFDSAMYRADQNSFMLYPARALPGFLDKNVVDAADVAANPLLSALVEADETSIVAVDARGQHRFAPALENVGSLREALAELDDVWRALVEAHGDETCALYEDVFGHRAFTGRSGTMYGYEGIGSIYWHMVSKLLLAVQERFFAAVESGEDAGVTARLADAYYRVRDGLGFTKSPEVYGAFPTDPYSHTPGHASAQQPGMTGQVKEEVLTRRGELGISVEGGRLRFDPTLLRAEELLAAPASWSFFRVGGAPDRMTLPAGALGFTVCQVPVVYVRVASGDTLVARVYGGGDVDVAKGGILDAETSAALFERTGRVDRIEVDIPADRLLGST